MQHLSEFALNHWMLVTAFSVLLGLLVANTITTVGGIATQEAVSLINREGAVVVDIRSAEDFAAGHIIDAVHFPLADLPKVGEKLKKLGNKPIIVCCMSGNLAGQAARELKLQGFSEVHALKGGISAWRADNLPVAVG
ncbi:MAG: rhodanese-like domain-containing protein [Gammaproteobacteria bacterium]|nr:rhodanese-like domain-containing protein [Gammaproteobacteria bacterium]